MPGFTTQYGRTNRLVATGVSTITSADAAIIGVLFNGTGTGQISIFHGVTASASAVGIRASSTALTATANNAVYYACPMYCSGGITVDVGPSADPDITLFWNPV